LLQNPVPAEFRNSLWRPALQPIYHPNLESGATVLTVAKSQGHGTSAVSQKFVEEQPQILRLILA
jgi:hypothetical protein